MNRAVLYLRVSTSEQSVDLQRRELLEFCQRRGWIIVKEYADVGVSGSKDSRPELNRLMAAAKRREFDVIVVWRLDRFGRSLRHLVTTLADLEALGVAFVSLKDGFDLSTPSGRLLFQLVGAMAEFERNLIRERVIAGQRAARAKGIQFGRPKTSVAPGRVAYLRSQGQSFAAIASQLGIAKATAVKLSRQAASATD